MYTKFRIHIGSLLFVKFSYGRDICLRLGRSNVVVRPAAMLCYLAPLAGTHSRPLETQPHPLDFSSKIGYFFQCLQKNNINGQLGLVSNSENQ